MFGRGAGCTDADTLHCPIELSECVMSSSIPMARIWLPAGEMVGFEIVVGRSCRKKFLDSMLTRYVEGRDHLLAG